MKPLVSFLLPTYERPKACARAIESILRYSEGSAEILLAINHDDTKSDPIRLSSYHNVRKFYVDGVVKCGWLITIYKTLIEAAEGSWIWVWNDDAYFKKCSDWIGELRSTPLSGFVVQGQSDGNLCFPCVPNKCWETFGADSPGQPIDCWLRVVLEENHGWKRKVLPVEIVHEWRKEME